MRDHKPYLFYGQTSSLCETCLAVVPAKILIEGDDVFYQKRCADHGVQKTLISTDAAYYKRCRDFLKPGDIPLAFQSRTHHGCPHDCGLCPDHEQHSCLALIEINEACNLTCPVCFADSSPRRPGQLNLAQIEGMMDALVESEGEPDLLQISGGEPTIHLQIIEILHLAKRKPIRHLMLNTNGVRIANDKAFVDELAKLKPGFEVYLQYDSRRKAALENIRGADLRHVRERALANLEAAGISTTLVCVVKKGVNDDEAGEIVSHALDYNCVRGVTFQPVQDAGRNDGFNGKRDRVLLTDIRRVIVEKSGVFGDEDVIPLPCNPESIAIGYGLREGRDVMPITRMIPKDVIVSDAPNAITFEKYPELRKRLFDLLSLSAAGQQTDSSLHSLLCCLPQVEAPSELGYDRVFRVIIVQFMDRFNFCVGGVKRSCIHFVTPEKKIIPFDTYNLFYRPGAAGNAALAKAQAATPMQRIGSLHAPLAEHPVWRSHMTDPPTGEHPPPPNVMFQVIGGILIAAGALLVVGSGLCTLWFVAMPMLEGGSTRFLGLALILGGLPMIYGGILCWSGRVLWHSSGGPRPLGLLLAVLLLGAFFFYVFMQSGPFGPS